MRESGYCAGDPRMGSILLVRSRRVLRPHTRQSTENVTLTTCEGHTKFRRATWATWSREYIVENEQRIWKPSRPSFETSMHCAMAQTMLYLGNPRVLMQITNSLKRSIRTSNANGMNCLKEEPNVDIRFRCRHSRRTTMKTRPR